MLGFAIDINAINVEISFTPDWQVLPLVHQLGTWRDLMAAAPEGFQQVEHLPLRFGRSAAW
jgi:hypothetical protein